MAEIFAECRRVLRDDRAMTLIFTHKATGALDALTKGLIDAVHHHAHRARSIDLNDPVKAAAPVASDFEVLENLRRLALAEQVPAPKQLDMVLAELAEAS